MCIDPSYIFKKLIEEEKPLSVILTSGTLSPTNLFFSELKTHFEITHTSDHVISKERVLARIINRDFQGRSFKFGYEENKEKNLQQFLDAGVMISSLAKHIQGGILIFFTSYTNLKLCYDNWRNHIDFGETSIFKEERDHSEMKKSFEAYATDIKEKGKAIFLCTCRGKLSEGLNFRDDLARACFVIGIPYFLVNDGRVILKKQVMNENCRLLPQKQAN